MKKPFVLTPALKFLVFIAAVLTFFIRPFALGLNSSWLTNLMFLFVCSIIASCAPPTLFNHKKILEALLIIYLIAVLIIHTIQRTNLVSYLSVFQIIPVYLLCRNYLTMRFYLKTIKNIFLVLIVFAIINFALECVYGGREALTLVKEISYLDGTYEFSLFFPLTWSDMAWDFPPGFFFSGSHSRQYFFFIEPGMAPPFLTSCLFMVLRDPRAKRKRIQVILFIIGILLTVSTGGPLVLMTACAVWYFSKHRKKMSLTTLILVAAGLFLAWYVYNYMPFFGRQAKMEISAASQSSIEAHEALGLKMIVGTGLIGLFGLLSFRLKKDKVLPIVIAAAIAMGNLSNYVGYTLLATAFLFWDQYPVPQAVTAAKIKRKKRYTRKKVAAPDNGNGYFPITEAG